MSNRKNYELIMQIKGELGSNFRNSFNTASESVRGLQNRLGDLKKTQNDVSAYQNTQKAIDELKKKKEELINTDGVKASEIEKVNRELDKQTQKHGDLSDKLKTAGVDTNNLTNENNRLGDEYDKLKEKQERMATLENWQQRNSEALSRARTDFLATTAVVAAAGATFYKAFISPAASFEAEMSNIAALTGYNAEQMKRLGDEVRATAQATGTPIGELAAKANQLVEVGGDLDLVISQMRYGTNLANATRTEIGLVYDFTSAAMKTFHMEAEESRAVMDSMAYTTSLTNLTLSQIAESYVNVGGSAKTAGFGINDVNAQLIVMSEAGLKGGAAGTSLNAILRNLSTPTAKAAGTLKELGVELYDAEGASRDMFDVMGDLQNCLSDFSDEERNNTLSDIFDTVALKGWNMLADEGIDNIRELSVNIESASGKYGGLGQAAGMAGVQLDNLKGDLALNKVAISELGMSIGEIFLPNIREAAQGMTGMINSASEWVRENPENVKQAVEFASKLALLTVAVKGLNLAYRAGKAELLGFMQLKAGASITGGRLARTLSTMNPVVAGIGLTFAGVAVAVELNKKKMRELREEYADPYLFDNGGQKLNELTSNIIENTRFQRENAQAVINSRERLSEIRTEIQRANIDLEFYGMNLREHGTLTPAEAEAMYEPFNNLAGALEDNFKIRYENVFEAFKIASGEVAETLGVDVHIISGILDDFNQRYTDRMSDSRGMVNEMFNRVSAGEILTIEDYEILQGETEFMRRLELATSDISKEFHRIRENIDNIDFGTNYAEAISEMENLKRFTDEYRQEIEEAHRIMQDEIEAQRRIARELYIDSGDMHAYNATLDGLAVVEKMITENYRKDFEQIWAEVTEIGEHAQKQFLDARKNLVDNMSYGDTFWAAFRADWSTGFGLWGDRDKKLEENLIGDLREAINASSDLIYRIEMPNLTIRTDVDDRASDVIYRMRNSEYAPIDKSEYYRQLQTPSYARNNSLAKTNTKPIHVTIDDNSGKEIIVEVNYAPVITIQGNASDNLEDILQRERQGLKQEFADMIRESEIFEKRTRFK